MILKPILVGLKDSRRDFGSWSPSILFKNPATGSYAIFTRQEVVTIASTARVPEPLAAVRSVVVVVSETENEASSKALGQLADVDWLEVGQRDCHVSGARF